MTLDLINPEHPDHTRRGDSSLFRTEQLPEQQANYTERKKPRLDLVAVLSGLPAEYRVLPISFLAACAIATTAASTITAYSKILCSDPSDCKRLKESRDATVIAISAIIANSCALLVLGPYERLSRLGPKTGLWVWLGLRGGSVVTLAVGGNAICP